MNTKIDENKAQFIKIIFKNLYKNPWQKAKNFNVFNSRKQQGKKCA